MCEGRRDDGEPRQQPAQLALARRASQVTLWANGLSSSCDQLYATYYDASSAVVATSNRVSNTPMIQQVQLHATTDPAIMVVSFVSSGEPAASGAGCYYGVTAPTAFAPAQPFASADTIGNVTYATLTGLTVNSSYVYYCTDGVLTSAPAAFWNRRSDREPVVVRTVVRGTVRDAGAASLVARYIVSIARAPCAVAARPVRPVRPRC